MKSLPLLLPSVLLAVSLFATGCKTTVNTVEPAQPSAQRDMLPDKRVITDTSLHNRFRVYGVNTITTPAGFLKIQMEVQNTTRRHRQCTYRIEWFDEHFMIINTSTGVATPLSLEGGETKSITAIAPTPMAKDFRIKFLEPVN